MRRKVSAPYKNYLWQMDLIQLDRLSRFNSGFKYILTIIDISTRFAYARCLKNKTGREVAEALSDIIKNTNHPKYIVADYGREFWNSQVQKLLSETGTILRRTYSEFKACVVERFNQTLLSRISKHFTTNNTKRYINILQDLVYSYNHSIHRGINLKPAEVDKTKEFQAWLNLHRDVMHMKQPKPSFKLNDQVRVVKQKGVFEKGHTKRFSDDVFLIQSIVQGIPITYTLKTASNESLNGLFYDSELSRVRTVK